MGKFVITKRANGEFQFNLKSNNGLAILSSEGYTTKTNCEHGIEAVQQYAKDDQKFERKAASNNKYYFNLKASNGQIVGTSQLYVTEFAREKGIESVKSNAVNAKIEDKTRNRVLAI